MARIGEEDGSGFAQQAEFGHLAALQAFGQSGSRQHPHTGGVARATHQKIDHGRIIADGTPAQIKKQVSGHRITCRTALSLAKIQTIAGVNLATREDEVTTVDTDRLEDVLRALLIQDATLSDLAVKGAALEDAFVALTNAGKSKETV